MTLQRVIFSGIAITAACLCSDLGASIVELTAHELRPSHVCHHPTALDFTIDGVAPSGVVIANQWNNESSYSLLDGGITASDFVTFSVIPEDVAGQLGPEIEFLNQHVGTKFGSFGTLAVTMSNIFGTQIPRRSTVLYDGFVGVDTTSGFDGQADRSTNAPDTGNRSSLINSGGSRFVSKEVAFDPTDFVTFEKPLDPEESIVIQAYDLQFSTIPEPSSLLLLSLVGGMLGLRRRR